VVCALKRMLCRHWFSHSVDENSSLHGMSIGQYVVTGVSVTSPGQSSSPVLDLLTLKTEVLQSSETAVPVYQNTAQISRLLDSHQHHCENFKSGKNCQAFGDRRKAKL